jgi:2Fe-2S ferredoxin
MEDLISITVIDREGEKHKLEAPTDMNMNMMELCKSYDLPVAGTCGGMAMCASCQMYVLTDHVAIERSYDEQAMLDEAWHVEGNSRLGCQIQLTKKLDGLEVQLAPLVEQESDDDW